MGRDEGEAGGAGLQADLQGIWFHQLTVTETKYLTKTTLDRDLFWLHTSKSLSLRSSCSITWYLRQSRTSWPWEQSTPWRQKAEIEEWPSKHLVCILLSTDEPQFTPFSGPPQIASAVSAVLKIWTRGRQVIFKSHVVLGSPSHPMSTWRCPAVLASFLPWWLNTNQNNLGQGRFHFLSHCLS